MKDYTTIDVQAVINHLIDIYEDRMLMVNNEYSFDEYIFNWDELEEANKVKFNVCNPYSNEDHKVFNLNNPDDVNAFLDFVFNEVYIYQDVTMSDLRNLIEGGAFKKDK